MRTYALVHNRLRGLVYNVTQHIIIVHR